MSITSIVDTRQQTIRNVPENTGDAGGKVIIVASSRKCSAGSITLLLEGISGNKLMEEEPVSHLEDSFPHKNALHDEIPYKNYVKRYLKILLISVLCLNRILRSVPCNDKLFNHYREKKDPVRSI